MNVCLDENFLTTESFVTKLDIVMPAYDPECIRRSYDQVMTVSSVSFEMLIPFLPNIV